MEIRTLQVNPENAGARLDAFLAEQLEDVTRSAAAKLCAGGAVTREGKPLAKNYRLTGGETIDVVLPDPEPMDAVAQDIPLDVVYEDADVIVVNKPKGLVVHPAPGHPDGTLVNALLHHCAGSLSGIGGALRPGIVHRIDRDTSGLIHVRCRLETGRTHQIRVHMAHIGHPILGDTVYGAKRAVPGLQGQCLHAVGLRFIHPRTGEVVECACPLPEEFREVLRKLAAKA